MISRSNQVKNSRKTGIFGEEIACRYFTGKGYRCLERNFHIQGGELDLILEKNGIIVFVEVKCRTNTLFGSGAEALTQGKKHKLLRAVYTYLRGKRFTRWQLDLMDIRYEKMERKAFIRHYPNILES